MRKLCYLWLLLPLVFTACSHNAKKGAASTDTVVVDKAITRSDTLLVQGRWIIFFQPSAAEYNQMQQSGEADNAFYSTASQFYRYMTTMVDSIKKSPWANNLQVTSQRVICIKLNNGKLVNINRNQNEGMTGVIFTNGKKQPQVDYGVQTDKGWWEELKRFFAEK